MDFKKYILQKDFFSIVLGEDDPWHTPKGNKNRREIARKKSLLFSVL